MFFSERHQCSSMREVKIRSRVSSTNEYKPQQISCATSRCAMFYREDSTVLLNLEDRSATTPENANKYILPNLVWKPYVSADASADVESLESSPKEAARLFGTIRKPSGLLLPRHLLAIFHYRFSLLFLHPSIPSELLGHQRNDSYSMSVYL